MSLHRLTVIITAFNRQATTLRALRDLDAQVLPANVGLSVVLVDDGSTDGTGEAVRAQFPEVRVIEGTGDLYWNGGMRLAEEAAWSTSPTHVLWLNDDVELNGDAVSVLLQAADATEHRAIVVGAVQDPQTGSVTYGGFRRRGSAACLDFDRIEPDGTIQDADTMNGNVVLVPEAVMRSVGRLDPAFTHNMADMDYGFRARAAGHRVVVAPQPVGLCVTNSAKHRWADPSVPLRQRWALVRSVRGMPVREWWTFTRRHAGWRWPRYFVSPYLRVVLAGLSRSRAETADRPLEVLHIFGPLQRSGAEIMWLRATTQLAERGVGLSIATLADEAESSIADQFEGAGVPVVHFGSQARRAVPRRLLQLLRTSRPNVVHVHAEKMSLVTEVLPRLLGIPVVRTVHSVFDFDGFLGIRKQLERWVAVRAGVQFVAVSASVAHLEQMKYRSRPRLILNWFDDVTFQPPSLSERQSAREALGIAEGRAVVAVVGNCSPVKRHTLLLDAVAGQREAARPVVLHIGDESRSPGERELAGRLGVDDDVRFLGACDDVARLLRAADVFVMPSTHEGLGIAALEALGMGMPAVVTDVPGLRDLPTYSDAVLVAEATAAGIRGAIDAALTQVTAEHRRDSAQSVRSAFGMERGLHSYLALYRH